MKDVEYFDFLLPPDIWRRKPQRSTSKMTMEEAARRYPGSTPMLETREIRRLPETDEEMMARQIQHNPRPRTPSEDQLNDWLISRIGEKSDKID